MNERIHEIHEKSRKEKTRPEEIDSYCIATKLARIYLKKMKI
jgi:hypothetical protein